MYIEIKVNNTAYSVKHVWPMFCVWWSYTLCIVYTHGNN